MKYLIVSLLLLCFVSCKKNGHGYIKGTVVETGTGMHLQGMLVLLRFWKDGSTLPSQIDTMRTDSKGNFIFYFTKQLNHNYKLEVSGNEHFQNEADVTDRNTDLVIILDPIAYVKIRLKKLSTSKNSCSLYEEGISYFLHDGATIDTLFPQVTAVTGNKTIYLGWVVHHYPKIFVDDPDYTEYNSGPLLVNKKDTLVYTVEYD